MQYRLLSIFVTALIFTQYLDVTAGAMLEERVAKLEEDMITLRMAVHDLRSSMMDTSNIHDRRGSLQRRPSIRRASRSDSNIRGRPAIREISPHCTNRINQDDEEEQKE